MKAVNFSCGVIMEIKCEIVKSLLIYVSPGTNLGVFVKFDELLLANAESIARCSMKYCSN